MDPAHKRAGQSLVRGRRAAGREGWPPNMAQFSCTKCGWVGIQLPPSTSNWKPGALGEWRGFREDADQAGGAQGAGLLGCSAQEALEHGFQKADCITAPEDAFIWPAEMSHPF